jgi:hypothetical protein
MQNVPVVVSRIDQPRRRATSVNADAKERERERDKADTEILRVTHGPLILGAWHSVTIFRDAYPDDGGNRGVMTSTRPIDHS